MHFCIAHSVCLLSGLGPLFVFIVFFLHRCHFHPLCFHSFIFSTIANFTVVKFYLRGVNKGMKCVCVHNHRFAFTYRLALDIHPKILTNVLDAYYNFIDKPCLGFTVHEIQQNSFTWSTVQKYLGLHNNCELRAVRVLILRWVNIFWMNFKIFLFKKLHLCRKNWQKPESCSKFAIEKHATWSDWFLVARTHLIVISLQANCSSCWVLTEFLSLFSLVHFWEIN